MRRALLLSLAALSASCATVSARQQSLEDVFDRVQTSVVRVSITAQDYVPYEGFASVGGVGSGVLVSDEGYIVTAAHVVQVADAVFVSFTDGTSVEAEIVGSDPASDVALLKLTGPAPAGVHVAQLADSDQVRVASRRFVIGAPRGIDHSLSVGHISARRKADAMLQGMVSPEYFQTDAAINQGNSGGPMFDMNGDVIGIVSSLVTVSGGYEGLGFAVTSNVARKLLFDRHAFWSGVEGFMLPPEMAGALNVPKGKSGFLVQRVAAGSPAHRMGMLAGSVPCTIAGSDILLGGDIVLSVQDVAIEAGDASYARIRDALGKLSEGDTMTVGILRGGEETSLSTTIKKVRTPVLPPLEAAAVEASGSR